MQKHILSYLLITILMLNVMSIAIISALPGENTNPQINQLSYTFSFDNPLFQKLRLFNTTFTKVTINDLPESISYGKPILPIKPVRILLPPSTQIEHISVVGQQTRFFQNLDLKTILLGGKEQRFDQSDHNEQLVIPRLFNKTRFYPETRFSRIGIQYFHGFPILYINLKPVQYLEIAQTLRFFPQMTLSIDTTPLSTVDTEYKMNYLDELYTMVDNPDMIQVYQQIQSNLNNEYTQQYDYVIISTDALLTPQPGYEYSFDDLLAYRTSQGLSCTTKSIEDINAEYQGIDLQEKIRNFIKDAYTHWDTRWVLLGGDVGQVPIRYLYDIDGVEINEEIVTSDLYYQCLDGTYNFDKDQYWGEEFDGVNGERIDLLAEVYIGRAPIDDAVDLSSFVEKTLIYETSEWGEDAYLESVLSAGETLWNGNGGYGAGYVERCIDYCDDYNQITNGIPSDQYTISELYERDEDWSDLDAIEIINNGVSIINHVGHGTVFAAMKLSAYELNELTNEGKYGLFYSQACHSGQLERIDECFAERWVNIPKKGGFAAIMNTGYGYGSTFNYDGADNRFAREFFDALFSENEQISRIGEANQDSKEDNIYRLLDNNMYHAYYVTTLFGDPYVAIKGAEEASADFTYDPLYPNPGDTISFYDNSDGMISYRKWDFGDGYISNEKNPRHTYASENTYQVSLTVMDTKGYYSTLTKSVEVKNQWGPVAVIHPMNHQTYNYTIQFSGADSWDPDGHIVGYSWDFDDGTTSDLMEPVHTFDAEGIYHVSMDVEDNQGNIDREYTNIILIYQDPPSTPSILHGPTSVFTGEVYNYSVVSTDPQGYDVQYGFDWDDTDEIEWSDWSTSGEPLLLSHQWQSLGDHTIQVKSRNINYVESNWSDPIHIHVTDSHEPFIELVKPLEGIYVKNEMKSSFFTTLVFGSIDISVLASDASGIQKVLFYIDDQTSPVAEALSEPYMFTWDSFSFSKHVVTIVAKDHAGKQSSVDFTVWKIF